GRMFFHSQFWDLLGINNLDTVACGKASPTDELKPQTPSSTIEANNCVMRLRIRIKHKKQQRQPSQHPQARFDLAHSPGNQLAERVKHKSRCNSDSDIVRKADQCDHCERWNEFGEIIEPNPRDR